MKKKLIISISALLGVITVVLTLCFTVFTVKEVEIDFRTSLEQPYDEEEIIKEANIDFGKCLLFMSKTGYIKRIEEKFPYLEVINIETVFPSKLVIHCAERQELFAFQKDDQMALLDKDFKVLSVEQGNFESDKENPILIKGLTFKGEIYEGKFLDITENGLKRFYSSMLENNKTLPQVLGFCKELFVYSEYNPLTNSNETNIVITTFKNREIKILNIDVNLSRKMQRMFQVLPMLYDLLVTNGDYTSEEVDRCAIVIGNQITKQDELYLHVYLDGNVITSENKWLININ